MATFRQAIVLTAVAGCAAVGCSREQLAAEPAPTPGSATSSAPPTTQPTTPSTAAPAITPDSTAPDSTAPDTTAPNTTAPAPSTDPAGTAPVAGQPPADVRVVTVQYGLSPIGVWDGAAWHMPAWDAAGAPTLSAEIASVVVTSLELPSPIVGASFGPLVEHCVTTDSAPAIVLPAGVEASEHGTVAVSADWNVQPRPVQLVGLDNPDYRALGASLVDRTSGADPEAGAVTQVVRADLDGDGIEEVLLTYSHQTDDGGFGAAGDYTLIIARYPRADGTVADSVVWSYYEEAPVDFPNPGTGELLAVADLNGDGVMEVVTSHSYWEAGTAEIHAFVDGRLTTVAGGGCGV